MLDVSVFSDEKSMMTYIASLYEALAADNPAVPPMPSLYGETVLNTTTQLFGMPNEATKQLQSRWSEYRTLAADLAQWLRSTKDRMASRHFPPDLESMEHRVLDDLKRHRREERPRRERDRQQLVRMFEELKVIIALPPVCRVQLTRRIILHFLFYVCRKKSLL